MGLFAAPGGSAGNAWPGQLLRAIATWRMQPSARHPYGTISGVVEHQRKSPVFRKLVHEFSTSGNI